MNSSISGNLHSIDTVRFSSTRLIGAKARSLQYMSSHGFPVPSGFILATTFFQPWVDLIRRSDSWSDWHASHQEQWPELCATLRAEAANLPFFDPQLKALDALYEGLAQHGNAQRYAVRSSSPDEDTDNASFAGMYETLLGIASGDLAGAIRRCFSSCLDYRVFVYKAAQGLDLDELNFALIVQLQIDSDVAGVGFSINPLSNDYDEVAIDANWGLGESVVSGIASPDHLVVNKLTGIVVERKRGAKQISVMLSPKGGTTTAPHQARARDCLTEAQIAELTTTICDLETMYGHPIDMEWAFAQGKLYVLQARPITSYVPLPVDMVSAPGAARTLYMDIALSKGMTSNAPISPIALDWFAGDLALLAAHCGGQLPLDMKNPNGLLYLGGARMYMNLSNLLWFSSPAQLAKGNAATDSLMADILAGIEPDRYRAQVRPAWIWPVLRMLPGALWRMRRPLWRAVRSIVAPDSTKRIYERQKQAFEQHYSGPFDNTLALPEFRRRYGAPAIAHIVEADMPAMAAGVFGTAIVKYLARTMGAEEKILADQLTLGLSGNLVVHMSIRIHDMATMLAPHAFDDLDALGLRIERRQLPATFLTAWDGFIRDYGCRGPGEMDMANLHYADDPHLLLRQMATMARSTGDFNPHAIHRSLIEQRTEAYDSLVRRVGWGKRIVLKRANKLIALFGGARDTPKQHNLMYLYAARTRLLLEGAKLVESGRIDRPEHVFDLSLDALEAGSVDGAVDLRALRDQRTSFAKMLKTHVRSFPAVIDSRGRIQRPSPRAETPGEMRGLAVSPGVARGKVKVLHNAHEKTVNDGEVLVAVTTDPGWTPLFVNAVAVVLEVGGVLQHGAVVAREFGKPCVAGVADVLNRFVDGQLVEVDGNAGVVRILADEKAALPTVVSAAINLPKAPPATP